MLFPSVCISSKNQQFQKLYMRSWIEFRMARDVVVFPDLIRNLLASKVVILNISTNPIVEVLNQVQDGPWCSCLSELDPESLYQVSSWGHESSSGWRVYVVSITFVSLLFCKYKTLRSMIKLRNDFLKLFYRIISYE